MPPDLVKDVAAPYLTNGVLGATCVVLAVVIIKLWNEIRAERAAHKVELASKEALIKDLYDARLAEARVGYEIARSTQNSLDAFLIALRGGKERQ